jgi:hypothetical protein
MQHTAPSLNTSVHTHPFPKWISPPFELHGSILMAGEQLLSDVSEKLVQQNPRWVRINNDNIAVTIPLLSLVFRRNFTEVDGSAAD